MADKFDSRVRHRYVAKGGISRDEVQKHIEALPDLTDSSEWVDYEARFAQEAKDEAESAEDAPTGQA